VTLAVGLAFLLLSLFIFDRPLIRGDAVAYFMWTASIGQDFDMDLANQAQRFGPLNTYMAFFNPQTGHYASVFAWGEGVILLPSFWAARLLDRLPAMRVNDDWFLSLQAYPFAYSLLAMLEVNALTVISAAVIYWAGRRLELSGRASIVAAVAAVWATPLYYYTTIQPVYAHAGATFAHTLGIGLFIWAYTAGEKARGWQFGLAGLALGLAALTRWQLALSALILAGLPIVAQRRWRPAAWLLAGFAIMAWHVPYTLNWMFGSPFTVPVDAATGSSGFLGVPRYILAVLFSGDRGWLVWSPFVVVSLLGLAWLARERRWAPLAAALALILLAQVLAVSGVRDWYAGESFGLRRMTELYPVVALGGAALLTWAGRAWSSGQSGQRVLAGAAAGLIGLCVVYGWVLIVGYPMLGYFSDPSLGFFSAAPAATAWNTAGFLLNPPHFDLIWPMMQHHFGPWAWTWPGP
jgi:hypothetical protein